MPAFLFFEQPSQAHSPPEIGSFKVSGRWCGSEKLIPEPWHGPTEQGELHDGFARSLGIPRKHPVVHKFLLRIPVVVPGTSAISESRTEC